MRTIHLKPIFIKIILALAIVILILLAICVAVGTARSDKDNKVSLERQQQMEAQYAQNVAKKTDTYELVKTGLRQLNFNLPNLALTTLRRAAQIQPDYRDAWLILGLAQAKTGDLKGALDSFRAAEKLDPIYAKTYEFLTITYENLGDTASAQKAGEKYDFLSKNP